MSQIPPSAAVLAAFGLGRDPAPLPGGQGRSWRVGDVVVKPLDADPAAIEWQASVLGRLDGRSEFRVSVPLHTLTGGWVEAGWTAWRFQPGAPADRRWIDIIEVGEQLHAALAAEAAPPFLAGRADRWSIGDRVAWGELPATDYAGVKHLDVLVAACRPVAGRDQLVHGDLTGNVLFHDQLPPLVIDLSPYWRPPAFAAAVVVADALVFEGAIEGDFEQLLQDDQFSQYLLRALIYRAVTDHLARPGPPRPDGEDPYLRAVRLATRLAGG
ncbi:MAG: hypothetical protein M3Y77_10575 [Actinomycetota bacterium]|nr:hypothetical protein [Actinomycetota bacterium]MDQ2846771.1 hypothetical protein [Actinomycetota bacterium]MDQ2958212.1 hypothetical protein [Actinomycetota bacterium]